MKITKTHKNASVQSIVDGTVTIITNDPHSTYVYYNAAIKSISDGTIVVEMNKPFTKSDLKTGMIVQYRNGDKRMFLNTVNEGVFTYRQYFMSIVNYSENLSCIAYSGDSRFDIVKVWAHPTSTMSIDSAIEEPGELLWERE